MITLKDYLIGIGVLTIVYYGIVLLKYYNSNLKKIVKRKTPSPQDDQGEVIDPFTKTYTDGTDDSELIRSVIAQIKESIQDASLTEVSKAELKRTIAAIFHLYPDLNKGLTRVGINEEILVECKKYKITRDISYSEVDELWMN